MRKYIYFLFLLFFPLLVFSEERNPIVISELLDRIGGEGTAARFVTIVDEHLFLGNKEAFLITSEDAKPCIKGNSILSVTVGINWYLNHYVGVNLSWNNLTTNLSDYRFPLPEGEEQHICEVPYRYYFNYCTFSYSMAFWSWERWEKEIDWMALHGINMPLALVGADVVWRNFLIKLGYEQEAIDSFIAGPGFQAWWLMNNLEGWGGPNPPWWYDRQAVLAKKILERERSFGMKPVLPGYSGMLPHDAATKMRLSIADPGRWCAFQRPGFLLPTDIRFEELAQLYYRELTEVMGVSDFYSMDPFHEGGSTKGVDLDAAFKAIMREMHKINPAAKWVIQGWNENPRKEALAANPIGSYVVLDLFSDGNPKWQEGYRGHDFVYCMLHNFGGRTGLHGRLDATIAGYYDAIQRFPKQLKGVGAAPEGIETNPMLYDALFELPWHRNMDVGEWLRSYVFARYGRYDADVEAAWNLLRYSVYNCRTAQQGVSEPIVCARPSFDVKSVSTWATSQLYYDPQEVIKALFLFLKVNPELHEQVNFRYDLVDIARQALTDYAQTLLDKVKNAYELADMEHFSLNKESFLQLILDLDQLLATEKMFRLGSWTESARAVAEEFIGTTEADAWWLEWNARTLVTVWGTKDAANKGGLHDYSNREWEGLLRDFHYRRWQLFFDRIEQGKPPLTDEEWFEEERKWTEKASLRYADYPEGDPFLLVENICKRYFGRDASIK